MERTTPTTVVKVRRSIDHWLEQDPRHVYIGRCHPMFWRGNQSVFANPYRIGRDGTREEVIQKYRTYMEHCLETGKVTRQDLEALQGKILGCWCKPRPCHGDVILELMHEILEH